MKKIALAAASLLLLFLYACSAGGTQAGSSMAQSPANTTYQTIQPSEAKALMEDGQPYILLDVRTQEEFEEARIEGAVLIPDYEIEDTAATKLPDKEARILVYCRSGRRSAASAQKLADMGYTNVFDFGGIIDWPYQTVSGQE